MTESVETIRADFPQRSQLSQVLPKGDALLPRDLCPLVEAHLQSPFFPRPDR